MASGPSDCSLHKWGPSLPSHVFDQDIFGLPTCRRMRARGKEELNCFSSSSSVDLVSAGSLSCWSFSSRWSLLLPLITSPPVGPLEEPSCESTVAAVPRTSSSGILDTPSSFSIPTSISTTSGTCMCPGPGAGLRMLIQLLCKLSIFLFF